MFGMKNKNKSEIEIFYEEVKKHKNEEDTIIIAFQDPVVENAFKLEFPDRKFVFLDGYTDAEMFKVMNAVKGFNFYYIRRPEEEYSENFENRLPVLAKNIYSNNIGTILNQIVNFQLDRNRTSECPLGREDWELT